MLIYVDIDNTICCCETTDYSKAVPIPSRIEKINKLFERGNNIVYWTARGSVTQKMWFDVTYKQLTDWGCKFNELRMGKPAYDMFIDDKNVNSDTFFSQPLPHENLNQFKV